MVLYYPSSSGAHHRLCVRPARIDCRYYALLGRLVKARPAALERAGDELPHLRLYRLVAGRLVKDVQELLVSALEALEQLIPHEDWGNFVIRNIRRLVF